MRTQTDEDRDWLHAYGAEAQADLPMTAADTSPPEGAPAVEEARRQYDAIACLQNDDGWADAAFAALVAAIRAEAGARPDRPRSGDPQRKEQCAMTAPAEDDPAAPLCHVVLDLETFGTSPDSAVVSIGAVTLTGETFYAVIKDPSGQCDPGAVRWWLQQAPDVRAAIEGGEDEAVVLQRFAEWMGAARHDAEGLIDGDPLRVWGSEDFDTVILGAAYARNGIPKPWGYQDARSLRTIFEVTGVDEDAIPWEGTKHIAVECARHAATALRIALDHQNVTPSTSPAATPLCVECGKIEGWYLHDVAGDPILGGGLHRYIPPAATAGDVAPRTEDQEPCCPNAEMCEPGDEHYCHVLGIYAPVVYLNAGYCAALRAEWAQGADAEVAPCGTTGRPSMTSPLETSTGARCSATYGPCVCTRESGHTGRHQARLGPIEVASWPGAPERTA